MTTPAPATRLRDDRDFRRYTAARVVSLSGSIVTAVAMPVLVYRLTGSPALTALTTTLEALPYLVVGLLAGALADRLDRKRVTCWPTCSTWRSSGPCRSPGGSAC